MDLVERVGEANSEELREHHPGVWRSLQLADNKARRDKGYVPRFEQLIRQSIARLEANRKDLLGGVALEEEVRDFWDWYSAEAIRRNVPDIESKRGLAHQDWVAKWMPEVWAKFADAYSRVVEAGTRTSLEAMRPASVALMEAYARSDGVRQGA
jgi:hypothetical protein